MKTILNHHNQENLDAQNRPKPNKTAHPSHETTAQPFRPTIKVGYTVVIGKEQPTRRYTKPVMLIRNQLAEKNGVRKVETGHCQALSGQFLESEYVPKHTEKSTATQHRKVLADAHQKNYGGRQFSQQLRGQFITRSRSSYSINERPSLTERQKLASYRNEGIKDILQYHHAGKYRPERLAAKCNNEGMGSRCLKFKELHEYDFRKSKPCL